MSCRGSTSSPIFVVGNRRSGTTMLRLMLSCHPNIGIPPEGGFIVLLGWKYGSTHFDSQDVRRQFTSDFLSLDSSRDWGFTDADLAEILDEAMPRTYPDALHAIYSAYLRKVYPGKSRWGDKTTWFSYHIDQILEYFPDAQIIHLVRDGRDVAVSYRGVPHLTKDVSKIAREWAINCRLVNSVSHNLGPARIHKLYYERLVQEPASELQSLCAFLHEEFAPQMLDFWEVNRDRELEPARHMPWKLKTVSPVSSQSVGRWLSDLNESDLRKFELIAGPALKMHGYSLTKKYPWALETLHQLQILVATRMVRFFLLARRLKARYW